MVALVPTIKHELKELWPPTLYFFVMLHVVALIRALLEGSSGIALLTSASATVAALILAKAVLIADLMPFINRYPGKPLVRNVVWKSTIYWIVATLLHYLERLYEHWHEAPGLLNANRALLETIVWPHFWAIQLLIALLIVPYCAAAELSRTLGEGELKTMFLGARGVGPSVLE